MRVDDVARERRFHVYVDAPGFCPGPRNDVACNNCQALDRDGVGDACVCDADGAGPTGPRGGGVRAGGRVLEPTRGSV